MQKRVFLITDSVISDQDLYSFEYGSDLFSKYLTLNNIKDYVCLSDTSIDNCEVVSYEKILTCIYQDLGVQNAQIVDVSSDHIKLTKFFTRHKALQTTSVKILIDVKDIVQNMVSISPNKLQYVNQAINWVYNRNNLNTGFDELNSNLLCALLIQTRDQIDHSIPLIILTDLSVESDLKNMSQLLYDSLKLNQDVYIYPKAQTYIYSHSYFDKQLNYLTIKCLNIRGMKKDNTITIEIEEQSQVNKLTLEIDKIKFLNINSGQSIRILDIHNKIIFDSPYLGSLIINTHDYTFAKKNM